MAKTYDLALTEDGDGEITVHRADCPVARAAADRGEPVYAMFGCTTFGSTMFRSTMFGSAVFPLGIKRHQCLDGGCDADESGLDQGRAATRLSRGGSG